MGEIITHSESFALTGLQNSVTTSYPIGFVPAVTLDAVSQSVYATGIDAQNQDGWYWSAGSTLLQWWGASFPSAGTLAVSYQAPLSNYVLASEPSAVTPTAHRSGKYEIATPVRGAGDTATALARASAILRRSGTIVPRVKWETDKPGYFPGQVLTIIDPRFNLTGTYIIESVTSSATGATDLGFGSCLRRQISAYKVIPATAQSPTATNSGSAGDPINGNSLFTSLGTNGGGSSSGSSQVLNITYHRMTFVLGAGGSIAEGTSITNADPIDIGGLLAEIVIIGEVAPVNQTLIIDITRNGRSILKKDTPVKLAPGEAGVLKHYYEFYGDPALSPILKDDILRADASYTTSSTTGLVGASKVTIQVRWRTLG